MSQQRIITGIVYDESGKPLEGATIKIKEHFNSATLTNAEGKFFLELPPNGATLVCSFIGMGTQEIKLDKRNGRLKIYMKKAAHAISDVVVIGYGSSKRRDLTGSISSVSGDDLNRGNPTNILEGLQGRVAGAVITQNDGAPGAGMTMQIRGANSFLGGTQPLYVIDGIPLNRDNNSNTPSSEESGDRQTVNALAFLNPADIASIEVLKDASATAIYGSRGANGVVLITTKKGKSGASKVELDMNYGMTQVSKKLDVLDGYGYATMQNEAYENANFFEGTTNQIPFPGKMIASTIPDSFYYAKGPRDFIGHSTNWQDEIFRTAATQNYTLSISGGNDQGNYLISGNFLNQDGIIIASNYRKYTIHTNLQKFVNKWLTIGSSTSFTEGKNQMVKTNTEDLFSTAGVVRSALAFYPTLPVRDSAVHDFTRSSGISNPYVYANDVLNHLNSIQIFSSNYMEIKLMEGLKFRQNIGISYYGGQRDQYFPRTVYEGMQSLGIAYKSDKIWQSTSSESLLSYTEKFGKHSIDATTGFTFENSVGSYKSMMASNFVNDLLQNNNMAAGQVYAQPQSGKSQYSLASVLGRVNYGYADKYLLTLSFRADGSSRFAKNNKWAYFPSAAVAWRLIEENFMKGIKFLSNAKIRASYGRTGNQAINPYESLDKLIPFNYPFNGTLNTGYADNVFSGPANDNLKWETTSQYNVGLDLGILQNRITVHADAYYKKTYDLLQNVSIPGSTGFTTAIKNVGSIQNKGVELTLSGLPFESPHFRWNISGNIAFNRNKILNLGGIDEQFADRINTNNDQPFIEKVGHPIGALYGYQENGIYKNEAQVRADPQYANQSDAIIKRTIGEISYVDRNGDATISGDDRTFIGNANPDFTYGFTNEFNFKQFDLSFFIQGVQGGDIINMNTLYLANIGAFNNITKSMDKGRWTQKNWEHATWPKAEYQYWRSFHFTRRFIEDGSYLRLKSVSLGYNLKFAKKIFEKFRIYVTGTNLFTITKYSGYDPDVNGYGEDPSRRGVDLGGYPNSRVINFGIQCIF